MIRALLFFGILHFVFNACLAQANIDKVMYINDQLGTILQSYNNALFFKAADGLDKVCKN